jgi:DNA repair protein RecO (recombination protein O)
VPFRDADLIVTLLAREQGKLSALARSARSSRRRFGGGLGSFTLSRAELTSRRTGDLWTLRSAEPIRLWPALAADVGSMAHAGYATELVREVSPPEQADPGLFDLLVELYDTVAARGPVPAVLRRFELALLEQVGLAPVLDRCIGCGSHDPARLDAPGAVMDPSRGGVACAVCAAGSRGAGVKMLSAAARAHLQAIAAAANLAEAAGVGCAVVDARDARDALLATVLAHVGKPLRSLEFLAKLSGGPR